MNITLLMVAFNEQAHVQSALLSVLRQRGPGRNIDVIFVNDGSNDRTSEIVRELKTAHGGIRLIETENQGVTRARNVALEALPPDSELVTFLDADDLVPPGRYMRDLELLATNRRLDLTYGSSMMFREPNVDDTGPAPGSETATGRGVQLAAGMYRYDLIRDVGFFDAAFKQAEDMDFLLRIFERSPEYTISDEVSLFYRRNARNLTQNVVELRREFAKALLYSVRRRSAKGLPPLPAGIFAGEGFAVAHEW